MGGRPRVHQTRDEFELGYFRLNLDKPQLDKVTKKLDLPADSDFRKRLEAGEGILQPADGQEVMITYKGRYVRLTYQAGKPARIAPEDN